MIDFLSALGGLDFIPAVLRVTTPILLAALGVLISERAGVLNLGTEGMMLVGAFCGVAFSALTGNAWLGFAAALVAGGLGGAILAFAVHVLRADLFLAGIAFNLMAAAGTTLSLFVLTGDKGMSGSLKSQVLPNIDIPLIDTIPGLGTIVSGHHVLTYAALIAVPLVGIMMRRTAFGLRLRAVGENKDAAIAAGLPVVKLQTQALVLSGVFAGAGGAFLSMGYVSWFSQNMSAGRGFIALAAEVMGAGGAFGTFAASLLLGTVDALGISFSGLGIPSELMQAMPYLVTVLALIVYALRQRRKALSALR